jgi:hypothetical protein
MANRTKKKLRPSLPGQWWLPLLPWGAALLVLGITVYDPRIPGFVLDRIAQALWLAFGNSVGYIVAIGLAGWAIYFFLIRKAFLRK